MYNEFRVVIGCLLCGSIASSAGCSKTATAEISSSHTVLADFQVPKDGRPLLLQGTVNGKAVTFLIDTGATRTAFDDSLRPDLGPPLGARTVKTVDGKTDLAEYRFPTVTFGNLQVKSDGNVFCSDLQSARVASGEDFSAILGMDVLKKYVVSFDFDRGKISLSEDLPGNPQTLGTPLKLSFQSDTPFLTASCGSLRQDFLIDTGATSSCIERNAFESLSTQKELISGAKYLAVTPRGQFPASVGLLHRFCVGSFVHEDLTFDEGEFGLLGLSYLSRYALTMDFPRSTIYLKKGMQYSKGDLRGTSGISLQRVADRLFVKSVKPGGPADIARIHVGDEVIAINGEMAAQVDLFRARQLLTSGPGHTANVKLSRNGQQFDASITMRDRLTR